MCCAAEMQLPSFYQSENPLFRSFGARGFLFAFLLACLCELHRIRIVQAEMGLAGSRTSFSFPPNRKPSFLSAIFCICHHVCPLVHPILPVTAFGWQFLTVAACSWSRFFFWVILQASPPLGDDTLYMASGGLRGTAPRVIAFRTKTALKSEKHTIGWYHVNNSGKGINLGYVEDFRYNEEFLAKCAPSKEEVLKDEAYTIYANALPRAFEKWCGYPAGSIYSTSDYYGNTLIFCDIQ